KPMLVQAAWAAVKARGRLQARYNRLVRRFGGDKNTGAKKKAITAIAHTLLKIAYQVLKSGVPYQDLGADFYTRRESPEQRQAWLERQPRKLPPGCPVPTSPPEAALPPDPGPWPRSPDNHRSRRRTRHPATPPDKLTPAQTLAPPCQPGSAAARS